MQIVSWNVAGINALAKKGLFEFIQKENAEVYCFQEVKASKEKMPKELDFTQQGLFEKPNMLSEYSVINSFSEKKGYSGVTTLTKIKPLNIIQGIGEKKFDSEGRVHTLEFKDFYLINAYFPNANRELTRLDYKIEFNKAFDNFCKKLEEKKPIVLAGDLNVAHKEIDLANPKQNEGNAGFTKEERAWFGSFLNNGHIDTLREFTKEGGNYTYWTYRADARKRNVGWRLDYFVVSKKMRPRVINSSILASIMGSDHCPIKLELD
ncbi:MAG: exodeoxyribonuclease III [archaeon]|jgi:exodeoxyribonuclease-3